jgi:hypothetical protein
MGVSGALAILAGAFPSAAADDLTTLGSLEHLTVAPAPQEVQEPAGQAEALPPPRPPRFGAANTWRLNVFGGGGQKPDGDDETMLRGGVGFSYFFIDNLSWEIELSALHFEQHGPDADAGNAALLLRWHLLSDVNWSLFVEMGAGIMLSTEDIPPGGSAFNFTPQAGGGFTVELHEDVRLHVGARMHHVSNGSLYDGNPGLDSWLVYLGVSVPF